MANDRGCSVDGCAGQHEARGWCAKHYQRFKAYGTPDGGKYHHHESELDALMARIELVPMSGCWIWIGNLNRQGYGVFGCDNKRELAHRASWRLHGYSATPGLQLNHRCDTPSCVNPAHLYEGTQKQNILDMLTRGRADRKGERAHGIVKLNEQAVHEIRSSNDSRAILAKRHGVCMQTITDVRTRYSWSHI